MNKLNIKTRMILIFGILGIVSIVIGICGIVALNLLEATTIDMGKENVPLYDACMEINGEIIGSSLLMERILSGHEEQSVLDEVFEMLDEAYDLTEAFLNGGQGEEYVFYATENPQLRNNAIEMGEQISKFRQTITRRYNSVFDNKSAEEIDKAEKAYTDSFNNLSVLSTAMEDIVEDDMMDTIEEVSAVSKLGKTIVLSSLAFGIVLVIVFALYLILSLNKTLNNISNKLSGSISFVASMSAQLAISGQQLSEGSTEQAASIEETFATMNQTSSMVRQNAENTRQANDLSNQASVAAAEGSTKMLGMTKSMDELNESSSEISKIIKVIDDIAFQTNMLALNAAVEAACAGDAGKGFAVVAQEVRNLAQKSAQAAKDTAEIIDRNIELSEQGVAISEDVNVSLDEIMQKSKNVNQLMGEIAAASDEQAKGTAQVTDAIGQMEKVVQSNAVTAEESASSAQELQVQATALEKIVIELNNLVKGKKANIKDDLQPKQIEQSENIDTIEVAGDDSMPKSGKQILSPDDVIPLGDDNEF